MNLFSFLMKFSGDQSMNPGSFLFLLVSSFLFLSSWQLDNIVSIIFI
jgi:hypothetical protein